MRLKTVSTLRARRRSGCRADSTISTTHGEHFTETDSVKSHASVGSEPAYCFLKMPMKPHIPKAPLPSDTFASSATGPVALITDWTVGWATLGSPSPQPAPLGRGRTVHRLSITLVPERAQPPSAKYESGSSWSLSLRERARVRGKYSVEHTDCRISQRLLSTLIVLLLGASGCSRTEPSGTSLNSPSAGETKLLPSSVNIDPQALVLAPHTGTGRLDSEIRRFQEQARAGTDPNAALERLGWLFVAKARESFDPGYYKLAEACAQALEARMTVRPETLLLRGHVLQNLHRFKEAEPLARELVTRRGLSFDYALLGDSLMEQGQLAKAAVAYQSMIDLRPDLNSYSRGAHLRWLKGDLTGALELMKLAVSGSSPLDPESVAWVHTRLAFYRLQTGAPDEAERECLRALQYQTDYPPALLWQGRIRLAAGASAEAIGVLQVAAKRNPLPEYQWVLAEALRQSGRVVEAVEVESQLERTGAENDPRSYALYLAT